VNGLISPEKECQVIESIYAREEYVQENDITSVTQEVAQPAETKPIKVRNQLGIR
jgi:hypothetical protein